jgi:hypothetical protein
MEPPDFVVPSILVANVLLALVNLAMWFIFLRFIVNGGQVPPKPPASAPRPTRMAPLSSQGTRKATVNDDASIWKREQDEKRRSSGVE